MLMKNRSPGSIMHDNERKLEDWVIEKRREFHRIPELSFREFKTQEKIIEILHEIGLEGKTIANTGVIATIHGSGSGSSIALRAEIDGLEQTEEITPLNSEYISQNHGFMHSCGHDGHIAIVLGAAMLLMQCRESFSGSIRFIFQPGEEQPPGGGLSVIENDGMKGVDAILGMHIFSIIDSGKITIKPGPLLASSHVVTIRINGKGGHYVRPQICIDPIIIASRFIECIHREIRKRVSDEKFILGFGRITGGSQSNRIPDMVEISGSFRTFNNDDTKLIEEILEKTLDDLMRVYIKQEIPGLPTYELDILHGYPVLVNHQKFSKRVFSILEENFQGVTNEMDPHFGADDFAYYLERVPGAFILLGTKNVEKGIIEGNHSSRFDIDEDILKRGVVVLTTIVLDFLNDPRAYI
jgi:amidohydrolase